MARTLITYGTRGGATADSAREIARVLQETFHHQVDVVDVKEIMAGRWKPQALRFLRRNDFDDIIGWAERFGRAW